MRTLRLELDPWNPDPVILGEAAGVIRHGGLVAFPTETVYGLGANALDPEAVKKIYAAKGRPSDNPLILHLSRPEQAEPLVHADERAQRLMTAFWPGPLTLVLKAKDTVPSVTRGGLETAALRMPDHPVASALIEAAGCPVAAPSANASGRPSPTDAQTVWEDLQGRVDMILDSGPVRVGIESTVVDVSAERPLLLRPGGMSREALEGFLGVPLGVPDGQSKRRSPGTRYRHYAPVISVKVWVPGTPLALEGEAPGDWAFMGLSEPPAHFGRALRFTSVENYARGLFAGFRALETAWRGIVVEWPPEKGMGLGLRDRICRAASAGKLEGQ
ncbi:MAG: threonylcarbamoyl-AMP synthase [Fretibacterium sp.]|nr:threonylcarbamoyl-AMP synthase [Fretibacterium sp.]